MLMRILVDMDGVLANLEEAFLRIWRATFPNRIWIPLEERRTLWIESEYPQEYASDIMAIIGQYRFFRTLPLIAGAHEAVMRLRAEHDIWFCSSPGPPYGECARAKYEWLEEHFGNWTGSQLILTTDKTLVSADALIDDSPYVSQGSRQPDWQHLLFDQAPIHRAVPPEIEPITRISWIEPTTDYRQIIEKFV